MCADFSQFLSKPAGKAPKPKALPIGDYPGIVKSHEYGDDNKNKTPYVRFHLGYLGWPDTVSESDRSQTDDDGVTHPIDLSKRQARRDFYLTDDALWRLDDFIKSCRVDLGGRSYEEIIPELVGTQVLMEVQQYVNQRTSEIGNQIGRLVGAS